MLPHFEVLYETQKKVHFQPAAPVAPSTSLVIFQQKSRRVQNAGQPALGRREGISLKPSGEFLEA